MKTSLSVLFVLALSPQVAGADEPAVATPSLNLPANGHCSSADGAIQYSSFQYQGGTAPPPGLLVSEQTLMVNGTVWGHRQHFQPGSTVQDNGSWPLIVDLGKTALVVAEGGMLQGRVIFTAEMTVFHLTADVAPQTRYVICENSWIFAP
jgi:hypothetical protein